MFLCGKQVGTLHTMMNRHLPPGSSHDQVAARSVDVQTQELRELI